VQFVSGVSDERLVELYAESEVAVVPSLYEGFSLPAVEAMATGVPLLATTGGAIPEVVGDDGTTAVLVPPGDAGALATAVLELLGDPSAAPGSVPPAGPASPSATAGPQPQQPPSAVPRGDRPPRRSPGRSATSAPGRTEAGAPC
jgi:hypothetical protein